MKPTAVVLASAALLALGAGTTVYAQSPERPGRGGPLTRAEVESRTAATFARMDANDDGVLDQADREAAHDRREDRREGRRDDRFERFDADRDGAISRGEYDAARDAAGERFAERRDHRGHRFGGRRDGHEARGLLRGADANGDMAVTAAEFQTAALERFTRADADRDGTVTRAERRKAMKAHRDERRARRSEAQS